MTSVLYGMVTDPKYVDMAREQALATSCIVCGHRGAVERAGMSWCTDHSTPSRLDAGSSDSRGDATARWEAWVAAASVSTASGRVLR